MKQVKIFYASKNVSELQNDINNWIKQNRNYEIFHDLTHYCMTDYKGLHFHYSVYLVYIDRS